ncbi:hypothetical protein [Bacillus sp. REN3]|uniref:hypothetical protein n=1 Tax=Bacillus sp. REN3 TaxID=2802440 RepID=UPI001AEEA638|nr:hypothetical protein [Bacillus sp. REN3]
MQPNKPGSNEIPDFKELNDRIIAETPSTPQVVIKTNLDPDDSTKDNPYYQNEKLADKENFKSFFEEKEH